MMRFRYASIVALLGLALAVPAVAAPVVDWDPIFTWEVGATPTNSPPGGQFFGVGTVSSFGAPLEFLNANIVAGTHEYTIYLTPLVSLGTVTIGPPATQFYTTNYSGGTITIYEDNTPDADFGINPPNGTVPSTFIDGTAILTGNFTNFYTQTNNFTLNQTGNMEGNIMWTGGTLLGEVSQGGLPCPSLFTGGLTWRTDVKPEGYIFRHDGKIDLNCPTAAEPSTWGRVKSQYR
jgi:hypothetical protein